MNGWKESWLESVQERVGYLYEPADIDTTQIEMLEREPKIFGFRVVLSGTPDEVWRRAFDRVWKESRYLSKLDAVVSGDGIRFICRESQGIEDYLFFIESRIEAANRVAEAYWTSEGVPVKRLQYERYPATFRPIGVF